MKEKYILLVEDNPDDEILITRSLKKDKILNDLVVVRDGEEALDYLFKQGKHQNRDRELPEVVLLDLKLPKLSGLEVLKNIRETPATKLLPVVVLTSSDEEKDMIESYQLGANSYVQKPVNFREFSDAIHQLGLYWLIINQSSPSQE